MEVSALLGFEMGLKWDYMGLQWDYMGLKMG